jgi:hypothetical protein
MCKSRPIGRNSSVYLQALSFKALCTTKSENKNNISRRRLRAKRKENMDLIYKVSPGRYHLMFRSLQPPWFSTTTVDFLDSTTAI